MAKQDVSVELFYSGVWNDHTSAALVRDQIAITRGRTDEGKQPAPTRCKLTFSGWRFNPHNVGGDLFGLIGRNTPLRVYLGTPHPGAANSDLTDTTDHVAPSLDSPTADAVLLCAWAAPEPGESYTLPASMTAGGSTTDTLTTMDSAYESISASGPTGTRTATFSVTEDYLAASVLLHGSSPAVTSTGGFSTILANISGEAGHWWVVVSYFAWDGTEIAATPDAPGDSDIGGWILLADTGHLAPVDTHAGSFRMKAWAKRVRTTGTHEITMDNPSGELQSIQSVFWQVADVGDWEVRFSGEVSSWTPRQSLGGDVNLPDRWVEVVATDVIRRLGQGQDPLVAASQRFILDTPVAALWPLDDGPDSRAARAVVGQPFKHAPAPPPLTESNRPEYGGGTVAPWLPRAIKLTNDQGTLSAPLSGFTFGGWTVDLMYRADQSTTGDAPISTALIFNSDLREIRMVWGTDDGIFGTNVLDDSGTILDTATGTDNSPVLDGRPHHVRWIASEATGTNTRIQCFIDGIEEFDATLDTGLTATRPPEAISLGWNDDVDSTAPVQLSMLAVFDNGFAPPLAEAVDAGFGHAGEHAGRRIRRLAREQDLTIVGLGDLDDTLSVGPQYPDGLLAILREAARVDLGDLLGVRTQRAVGYRPGRTRYNQVAVLALDYAAAEVAPPLDPVVDDQASRNDVTARRRDGGEQRRVDTEGPLGVDTIGRYDAEVTVNTLSDGHDLASHTRWRLHLGTVEGTRFPKVTVDLDATPTLASAAGAADSGDLLTINNLPAELTPDLARLLVLGYQETIGSHRRKITFNCAPEEPYHIAEVEHAQFSYIGSDGTVRTAGTIDSTQTSINFEIANGYFWTDSDFPVDVMVNGERMTLTAISATGSDNQTFTVTRSVNGVVKSHPNGVTMDVFHKSYIGL